MTQDPTAAHPTTPAPTYAPPYDAPYGAADAAAPAMTRSEERLVAGTQPVVYDRVRVRKRIVTEVQNVQVQVRREELVLESAGAADVAPGAPVGSPFEPLVVVLRREVPEVTLRVAPYERAVVDKQVAHGTQQAYGEVRREVIEVDSTVPPRTT